MANDPDLEHLQCRAGLRQLALQRPHEAGKGSDGRKTMGQRAGDGIGVLHAQARQHQHGFWPGCAGRAHAAPRWASNWSWVLRKGM